MTKIGIKNHLKILEVGKNSQRRNVHPLDFRVKSNFSTVITSLDDAPNIWPSWHFCTRWYEGDLGHALFLLSRPYGFLQFGPGRS